MFKKPYRQISASIVGNTLEWYEFSLYLHYAPLFSALFFPAKNQTAGLLQVLLIFAVGFLSRPLGGTLFGKIGDKFGRKTALLLTIMLMALPTALIGLLPTYAVFGIAAPLLLVAIRFLQGFPTGGEFPGAMCYLVEMAKPGERGFMGSFAYLGSQLGSILSTIEFLLMSAYMDPTAYAAWGWRISFLVGGLLGLGGWYLRHKLVETPAFETIKRDHNVEGKPLHEVMRNHKDALIRGLLICVLPLSGWYLVFVFTPLYFSQALKMDFTQVLLANALFLGLCNIFLLICGKLGDRYDKRKLMQLSAVATIVLAFPFYDFAIREELAWAFVTELVLIFFLSIQFALLPTFLCALFPTPVRYTGVGLSYNICNALFGGVTPLLAFTLIEKGQALIMPAFVLVTAAAIAIASLWRIKV